VRIRFPISPQGTRPEVRQPSWDTRSWVDGHVYFPALSVPRWRSSPLACPCPAPAKRWPGGQTFPQSHGTRSPLSGESPGRAEALEATHGLVALVEVSVSGSIGLLLRRRAKRLHASARPRVSLLADGQRIFNFTTRKPPSEREGRGGTHL